MVTLYCYPLHCNHFVMYLREGPLSLGWGGIQQLRLYSHYRIIVSHDCIMKL